MKIEFDIDVLKSRARAGLKHEYLPFWSHRAKGEAVTEACLSQWFPSPFFVSGAAYATAEHWMMAEKARLFDDDIALSRILEASDPAEAKALGSAVRNFKEELWSEHREDIVLRGNWEKFLQNEQLGDFLLSTRPKVLVEASPVDRIWGIGLARDDARAQDPMSWQGLNLLGFALMTTRDHLARLRADRSNEV